jgi:hypothetical protein
VVDALVNCHNENPLAKFWGTCNDQKAALDICFKVRGDDAGLCTGSDCVALDRERRTEEGECCSREKIEREMGG